MRGSHADYIHSTGSLLIVLSALSNVLLITILIAILSNKFAEINANAQEEVRDVSLLDKRSA
jgi:hypothetical protein